MLKPNQKNDTVCMISSYPPARTGIAEYCYNLAQELTNHYHINIITENCHTQKKHGNPSVFPTWIASHNIQRVLKCKYSIFKTFKRIAASNSKIVHIQHEPFIFGVYGSIFLPFLMLLIKLFLRMPILLTMHTVIPLPKTMDELSSNIGINKRIKPKIMLLITYTKLTAKLSNKIIVHSDYARKILIEEYGTKKQKVVRVSHGFKTEKPFPKEMAKKELDFLEFKILLFHGFLKPSKGTHNIIMALSKMSKDFPKLRLVIAGSIPTHGLATKREKYIDHLRSLAQEKGILDKVFFFNEFIEESKLSLIISASDIVILPYEKRIFGASGVLYKIGCYGKPIIVSDIPIFSEVIQEGETGLLVPQGNFLYLAKAIETLLLEPSLAKKVGQNLRKNALNHSWKHAATKHVTIYKAMLTKNRV